MAQKVILIDDLDGSEGVETLRYTVDGQEYEIDLSGENVGTPRVSLKPCPLHREKPPDRAPARGHSPGQINQAPDYQRQRSRRHRPDQGMGRSTRHPVNPRGRIKKETLDQYEATHGKSSSS